MGILSRSLPQERCEIIVIRTLTPTLVIDEIRIAIMVEHHVTSLKVTIEETVAQLIRVVRQVLGKEPEVGLELQLMEIKFSSFQETVLEIVQVEEDTINIKLCLWIAVGEVQFTRTTYLDIRQFTDRTFQQFLFLQGISPSCLTSSTYRVKKGYTAQIRLDIS